MAKAPRKPAPQKAARAGKDMHNPNPRIRKEAAEVLAIMPRGKKPPKK